MRTNDTSNEVRFGTYAPNKRQRVLIGLTRRQPDTWLGRRIAFVLRRLVMSGLSQPLDVDAIGQNLRLYPFHNVCEKRLAFTPQYFDARELAILSQYIHANFTFVDIGANIGAYALFVASQAGPAARIIAIEPQPIIYDRLLYNIAINRHTTITALRCAIYKHDGTVPFFVDQGNSGESRIAFPAANAREQHRIDVEAKTLLSVVTDNKMDRIDALKIDIEGTEAIVLTAFFATAPEALWPELLILEDKQDRSNFECVQLCMEHGYRLLEHTKLNAILIRSNSQHPR